MSKERHGPARWIPPLAGAALFAASFLYARACALSYSYPDNEAAVFALYVSLLLELVWLPVWGAVWIDRRGGGVIESSLAWCGAFAAGLGLAVLMPGDARGLAWGQGIVLAFALALLAVGNAPCVFRISPAGRRARVAGLLLILLTSTFWSGAVIDSFSSSLSRDLAKVVAVWLAPAACVSTAFETFDFAYLPRVYGMWLGPMVPYPSHPAIYIAGLLVFAGLVYGVTFAVGKERKECACG